MNKKSSRGFTIVELLVVIVVIGILAAITIVSYSGITAKANTAKSISNANSIAQVINIYVADTAGGNGTYPANSAAFTTGYTNGMTKVPTGVTVADAVQNKPDNGEGLTTIRYKAKGTTGGCLGYWDFTGTPAIKYLFVGDASSADFTQSTPSCS